MTSNNLKRGEYVEYDIDEINFLIYNDLPVEEDIEQDEYLEDVIDKMLMKGEKAKLIRNIPTDAHWVTNYGRVLNSKRVQEMTVAYVRKEFLAFYCVAKRWKLDEIMTSHGFEFDKDKLIKFYQENNYPYKENNRC